MRTFRAASSPPTTGATNANCKAPHRAALIGALLFALAGCGGAVAPGGAADAGSKPIRAPAQAWANDDLAGAANTVDGRDAIETQAETKISIDNFTFRPETLEVAAGTTVVWVNSDDVPHTVRSTIDLFRSEALDTDDAFSHRFSQPGTYEYYCGVHPHMTGKVVVK